jgi:hypothetical protein
VAGLRAKDGYFKVRSKLGELNQSYWSDKQILMDLNIAARAMCSTAQSLTKYSAVQLQLNASNGTQEAPLPLDIDEVKSVKYFSGQLYSLEFHDWDSLQTGASTGSIPRYFYIKTDTTQLTPQNTGTSNIQNIPIGPQGPLGDEYRQVLGVWPIPPIPAQISVWYSYLHKWMQDPTDPCAIPYQFIDGWVAYVLREALRIEKAYDEAMIYDTMYKEVLAEYKIYAAKQRNGSKFAQYGVDQSPWRQDASSSVILVNPNPLGP